MTVIKLVLIGFIITAIIEAYNEPSKHRPNVKQIKLGTSIESIHTKVDDELISEEFSQYLYKYGKGQRFSRYDVE